MTTLKGLRKDGRGFVDTSEVEGASLGQREQPRHLRPSSHLHLLHHRMLTCSSTASACIQVCMFNTLQSHPHTFHRHHTGTSLSNTQVEGLTGTPSHTCIQGHTG